MEDSTCSFLATVGGHCGSDTKDRTGSVEMVSLHASLGVSWKRSSPKCSIPVSLSKHNATFAKKPKAERGLSKYGSQIVLKETGIFLPVGAGQS